MLSLEFNRLLAYYQDMPDIDLNADDKKDKEKRAKRDRDDRNAERGMERIYVNVGKRQGFYPGNLMEPHQQQHRGQQTRHWPYRPDA